MRTSFRLARIARGQRLFKNGQRSRRSTPHRLRRTGPQRADTGDSMICAGKRLCRTRRWPGSPRRRLCRRGRPGWILCTPRRCSRRTGCSCRFRLCLCRSSRRFAQAAVRGWMVRSGSHIARFAEHGWTKRFCRRLCRNGSPSRSRFRNPNSRFLRLRSWRMRSFWKNLLF